MRLVTYGVSEGDGVDTGETPEVGEADGVTEGVGVEDGVGEVVRVADGVGEQLTASAVDPAAQEEGQEQGVQVAEVNAPVAALKVPALHCEGEATPSTQKDPAGQAVREAVKVMPAATLLPSE